MKILNLEKDQLFLRLMYQLQNNRSNAILRLKETATKLCNETVCYDYDDKTRKYSYHLQSQPPKSKLKDTQSLGGRPAMLTDSQIKEIISLKPYLSNRELGNMFNVHESTIRKAIKNHEIK